MSYGAAIQAGTGTASSMLNAVANNKVGKAMEKEYGKELDVQEGYSRQASGVLQGSIAQAGASAAKTQLAEASAKRMGGYSGLVNNQPIQGVLPMLSPDTAWLSVRNQGRANLGAYDDWAVRQAIRQLRTQQELNKIINFAGGQQNVYAALMNDAMHSQDDTKIIASILAGGGAATGGIVDAATGNKGFGSGSAAKPTPIASNDYNDNND